MTEGARWVGIFYFDPKISDFCESKSIPTSESFENLKILKKKKKLECISKNEIRIYLKIMKTWGLKLIPHKMTNFMLT